MFAKNNQPSLLGDCSRFNSGNIKGKIYSSDSFYFNGNHQGEFHIQNSLIIGEKAIVKGIIKASNLIVYGKIEGDIEVLGTTKFGHKAIFNGKIKTRNIEVHNGAQINANCIHNAENIEESIPPIRDDINDNFVLSTNSEKEIKFDPENEKNNKIESVTF
jgi:cytoskeletal protein CcmA (bactofilin family)